MCAATQKGGHMSTPDQSLPKRHFSLAPREPSTHERQAFTLASLDDEIQRLPLARHRRNHGVQANPGRSMGFSTHNMTFTPHRGLRWAPPDPRFHQHVIPKRRQTPLLITSLSRPPAAKTGRRCQVRPQPRLRRDPSRHAAPPGVRATAARQGSLPTLRWDALAPARRRSG